MVEGMRQRLRIHPGEDDDRHEPASCDGIAKTGEEDLAGLSVDKLQQIRQTAEFMAGI
jgi:hypothetical protein